MLDCVELLAGSPTRVLDLDPVTLSLARGAFEGNPRVEVLELDLREPAWTAGLGGPFDAVLTATALHWFHEKELLGLYQALTTVLRPGGVFANRDHMPIEDPALAAAADEAV